MSRAPDSPTPRRSADSGKATGKPTGKAAGKSAGKPAKAGRRGRARLKRVDEISAGGLVVDLRGDVPRGALIARVDRRGRHN